MVVMVLPDRRCVRGISHNKDSDAEPSAKQRKKKTEASPPKDDASEEKTEEDEEEEGEGEEEEAEGTEVEASG